MGLRERHLDVLTSPWIANKSLQKWLIRRGQTPRRYFVDENGRRVLIGLSIEETFEFEALDNQPMLEEGGKHVAWDENGRPTTARKRRWLELYGKNDRAWRQWMDEIAGDRSGDLNFIN